MLFHLPKQNLLEMNSFKKIIQKKFRLNFYLKLFADFEKSHTNKYIILNYLINWYLFNIIISAF